MEKLIKKSRTGVIARFYSMEVKHKDGNIPDDLKGNLEKHHRVFQDIPKGLLPSKE